MKVPRSLWFALLAPLLAFGAEGAFGWWMGDYMCESASFAVSRAVLGVVTIVTLVIALIGLTSGISNYRAANPAHVAADRVEFMALGGIIVSGSFVIALIWFGLNVVFVHQCGGMR